MEVGPQTPHVCAAYFFAFFFEEPAAEDPDAVGFIFPLFAEPAAGFGVEWAGAFLFSAPRVGKSRLLGCRCAAGSNDNSAPAVACHHCWYHP